MNYPSTQYAYPTDPRQHIPMASPMHYPTHLHQSQHLDTYYHARQHAEYAEFGQQPPLREEFEETGEVLTRPRLTKEQVDVLESQFQAHPKPNSNVKRELAVQTQLSLPRVAVSALTRTS
jgi:hypothetical protein